MAEAPSRFAPVTAHGRVGCWKLGEELGKGGNATVWAAVHAETGETAAVKLLDTKKRESERFLRFVREIETLAGLGEFDGVLPVLDFSLRSSSGEQPWLAMPVATPMRDALAGAPLERVVGAVRAVADTLGRLAEEHDRGHRDIKPGNLYELNGAWLVGDFGLVDGSGDDELTRPGSHMGPAHFTSYEMILDPATADSKPADVYSLGKTLWCLATEETWPPEGNQPADTPKFTIADMRPHPGSKELDQLVDRMTRLDAQQRPTMRSVATELAEWDRPRAEPVLTGLAELRARYRERRSPEISERERLESNVAAAEAALVALDLKWKALNDALSEVDDHAVLDTWRVPEMLERNYSHRGSTTAWEKGSSSNLGEDDWQLALARHVELLSDGALIPRWSVFVGTQKHMGGTAYAKEGRDYEAPVASIEQAAMLDRFIADVSAALRDALEMWVDGPAS
jgi:serine/threonine protein kinase